MKRRIKKKKQCDLQSLLLVKEMQKKIDDNEREMELLFLIAVGKAETCLVRNGELFDIVANTIINQRNRIAELEKEKAELEKKNGIL